MGGWGGDSRQKSFAPAHLEGSVEVGKAAMVSGSFLPHLPPSNELNIRWPKLGEIFCCTVRSVQFNKLPSST